MTITMAMGTVYAQSDLPPGYASWPIDSVVNGSVHKYTVPGDVYYDEPSSFVWMVEGGTLYFDEAMTQIAGDGNTYTAAGNASNVTTLWVSWDKFTTPLDTGYVCVHEISSDGCQYELDDTRGYSGMRVRVSAPPKVHFLADVTNLCSYDTLTMVIVQIDGMPPFDLKYSIDGVVSDIHVEVSDLADWDNDGETDNIAFVVEGFNGTTEVITHRFELIEASSGGVPGEVLQPSVQTVNVYVQPPAPVIFTDFVEVTRGQVHTYTLLDSGLQPSQWYWDLIHPDSLAPVAENAGASWPLNLDFDPAQYMITANYVDVNGCYSPYDSLWIEIFDSPTIRFAESTPDNIGNCSHVNRILSDRFMYLSDMQFDFLVEYSGATHYNFTWCVKDYDGNKVLLNGEEGVDIKETMVTMREFLLEIQHTFENTELPAENRVWTVEILEATNYEGIQVEIVDGVRKIEVHPKPEILEDIDFAN